MVPAGEERIIAVVQARAGSTRLPGKVLKPLLGRSVLEHVIRRVTQAQRVDEVVLATTTLAEDDDLERVAAVQGIRVIRGSVDDVLSRYAVAACEAAADHVVRVTADCPCIDPVVIDRVVAAHREAGADYTSNTRPRSFPHGLDVEVVRREALDAADRESVNRDEREHVLPFVWSQPARFRLHSVHAAADEVAPYVRVTLDTPEDYVMLQALFDLAGEDFHAAAIVAAVQRHPWLCQINQAVRQKLVLTEDDPALRARLELEEAARWASDQGLPAAARYLRQGMQAPLR